MRFGTLPKGNGVHRGNSFDFNCVPLTNHDWAGYWNPVKRKVDLGKRLESHIDFKRGAACSNRRGYFVNAGLRSHARCALHTIPGNRGIWSGCG